MRRIKLNLSSLTLTRPHEYAIRFLFGGLCTVMAGLIAKRFGPIVGGLFLAFPAIFPASASLIEAHEKERKAKISADGRRRGRLAASLDSLGAALGCVGLIGFAAMLWIGLSGHNAYLIIGAGTMVWGAISYLLWALRSRRVFRRLWRSRAG
jgi:hypothetical protein